LSIDRTAYILTISADELAHTAALIAALRKELPEEPGLEAFFDELRAESEAITQANDFLDRVVRRGCIA
jgi:hypothetical protein